MSCGTWVGGGDVDLLVQNKRASGSHSPRSSDYRAHSQKLFRVSAGGCSGVRCLSSVIRFSHPSCLAKRLYDSIVGALRYLDTAQHGSNIAFHTAASGGYERISAKAPAVDCPSKMNFRCYEWCSPNFRMLRRSSLTLPPPVIPTFPSKRRENLGQLLTYFDLDRTLVGAGYRG